MKYFFVIILIITTSSFGNSIEVTMKDGSRYLFRFDDKEIQVFKQSIIEDAETICNAYEHISKDLRPFIGKDTLSQANHRSSGYTEPSVYRRFGYSETICIIPYNLGDRLFLTRVQYTYLEDNLTLEFSDFDTLVKKSEIRLHPIEATQIPDLFRQMENELKFSKYVNEVTTGILVEFEDGYIVIKNRHISFSTSNSKLEVNLIIVTSENTLQLFQEPEKALLEIVFNEADTFGSLVIFLKIVLEDKLIVSKEKLLQIKNEYLNTQEATIIQSHDDGQFILKMDGPIESIQQELHHHNTRSITHSLTNQAEQQSISTHVQDTNPGIKTKLKQKVRYYIQKGLNYAKSKIPQFRK
jgi:hypothetical protein